MRRWWILLGALGLLVGLSSPGTAQWQYWVVDPGQAGQFGTPRSAQLDASNNGHICYYTHNPVRRDLLYAYFNGVGWVLDTVDTAGDVGKWCSLELDSQEWEHISYFDDTNNDLKYAYWDGANWVIQVVDTGLIGDTYTSLVLDPSNDHPHISYQRDNNLWHAWWDGANWQREVVDPNPWTGYDSSIDLDPATNYPRISELDALTSNLKYAYWNGASWNLETVDSSPLQTSLDISSTGVPHISYNYGIDPFNSQLRHAWRVGPSNWQWEVVTWASTAYGLYSSIRLDGSDNPRISFYDAIPQDLVFSSKNGSWSGEIVDQVGMVGQYTSLVLQNDAVPCISYYDGDNEDLKFCCKAILDIGVDSILAPPDTVGPGVPNAVWARFKNYGTVASSACSAYCTIQPGYVDTITVPGLASDDTVSRAFRSWTETQLGPYQMCVFTDLPGDSNRGNDTLCKPVWVYQAIHDCGANSIISPPANASPGASYPVQVEVQNFGNVRELSCGVHAWDTHMGGVYNQMVTCSLNAGEQRVVTLPNWDAPPLDTLWEICARTICAGDTNTANDSTCKNIDIQAIHDGACIDILQPPVFCDPFGGPYAIEVVVHNYGDFTEPTIPVNCLITPDNHTASGTVINLASGAEDTILLTPSWTPATLGPWTICAWTVVGNDANPDNDTTCKFIDHYVHDGGIEIILNPPNVVIVADTHHVEALVRNYGTIPEGSFDVRATIDDGIYPPNTVTVFNLLPDSVDTVRFNDWIVPAEGTFNVCCTTMVSGDIDPSNDRRCKTVLATGVEELSGEGLVPKLFGLSQSLPNPFTHATVISYAMPEARHTTLAIYDLTGSLVRTLVDEAQKPAYYSVVWDGRDESGAEAPSGIYFYRLQAGNATATRKLVILR